MLSLVNESGTGIFTRRLSCSRALILTDINGAVYNPAKEREEFVCEFISPSHALGSFLSGQRLNFSIESSESIDRDLTCNLNGLAVDVALE
jgi:hypothetical protein